MLLRRLFWFAMGVGVVLLAALAGLLVWEATTFTLEAKYLTRYAEKMQFYPAAGISHHIVFPHQGPADVRMGYVALPDYVKRLTGENFVVTQQARISPAMQQMAAYGLNLPYHEKDQAGLVLQDDTGAVFYRSLVPQRAIADYAAIPPILRDSLLFIENRRLFSPPADRNPAVEWRRLAQAIMDKLIKLIDPTHDVPGGSTLATQIEKFRHSRDGLTLTMRDKWQQMASASVRAYLGGKNTLPARRALVLAYLNGVPLSAAPGAGEVIGLPDALMAWYGLDWREVSALLMRDQPDARTAYVYKHALSLLISQRKPYYFLNARPDALEALTNTYLRLLAANGVISPVLCNLALATPLRIHPSPLIPVENFVNHKAANATRNHLASILGLSKLYILDRLDLTVQTTLNAKAQQKVSRFLTDIGNPTLARANGLYGFRLLGDHDDLRHIIYSFTLYERTPQGGALRVQADNLNQPFDINRGAKLDMGSTAKLRTLITYLQIVSDLHHQYSQMDAAQLAAMDKVMSDPISNWAQAWYASNPDKSLTAMLRAAMARQYSANPQEVFFTAGGLHHFVNFDKKEDAETMDLWQATRDSVNLVYIRLMRDVERYYIAHTPGIAGHVLEDARDPARHTYLERFADREGQDFMLRFYKKYRGKSSDEMAEIFLDGIHPSARRLAAAFRYLAPKEDFSRFSLFLRARAENPVDDRQMASLYREFAPGAWSLTDLGYIIQVHPLELWLVAYLRDHPGATFAQAVTTSRPQRIEVYNWLFHTGRKNAQDIRIRSLLEVEAFAQIYQQWKQMGYPFDNLVPSYATALGVSADRPAALAQLMGIILNNGVSMPNLFLTRMNFGDGTPYATDLRYQPPAEKRLLPAELTAVVREALASVVQSGTAAKMANAYHDANGVVLPAGGKTGTGDHHFDTFDTQGNVITSRPVSRTGTLVFYIGDKYFGTMTAMVRGEVAGNYHFTSALAAQIMKAMSPWLLTSLTAPDIGHKFPSSCIKCNY